MLGQKNEQARILSVKEQIDSVDNDKSYYGKGIGKNTSRLFLLYLKFSGLFY